MRYSSLIIITFLILSFLIGVFYTFPAYQSLVSKKEEVKIKKEELSNIKENIKHLYELESKLNENSENLKKVEWALPEKISIPQIFDFIKKSASENGLILNQFENFSENISKNYPNLKEISFSVSLAGNYLSFKNFISTLEKNSKIFEIEKATFRSPEKEDQPFNFNLEIKTYSF